MHCGLQYLLNLDLNSAHYDPKTRAMRENPFEGKGVEPSEYAAYLLTLIL